MQKNKKNGKNHTFLTFSVIGDNYLLLYSLQFSSDVFLGLQRVEMEEEKEPCDVYLVTKAFGSFH